MTSSALPRFRRHHRPDRARPPAGPTRGDHHTTTAARTHDPPGRTLSPGAAPPASADGFGGCTYRPGTHRSDGVRHAESDLLGLHRRQRPLIPRDGGDGGKNSGVRSTAASSQSTYFVCCQCPECLHHLNLPLSGCVSASSSGTQTPSMLEGWPADGLKSKLIEPVLSRERAHIFLAPVVRGESGSAGLTIPGSDPEVRAVARKCACGRVCPQCGPVSSRSWSPDVLYSCTYRSS